MSVKGERRHAHIFCKYAQHAITQNSSIYTHKLHVCECVHSCACFHSSLFDPGSHATRPATHLTGVSKTEERSSENEATDQVDPDLVLQNVVLFELPIQPPKGHASTTKKRWIALIQTKDAMMMQQSPPLISTSRGGIPSLRCLSSLSSFICLLRHSSPSVHCPDCFFVFFLSVTPLHPLSALS
jgi:hypothetical protein